MEIKHTESGKSGAYTRYCFGLAHRTVRQTGGANKYGSVGVITCVGIDEKIVKMAGFYNKYKINYYIR
jgi:hypothetical protein